MKKLTDLLGKAVPHKEVLVAVEAEHFLKDWPTLVGPELAARTKFLQFDHGTILVQVTGSAWANEIILRSPEIVERLNRKAVEAGLKTDTFINVKVHVVTSLKGKKAPPERVRVEMPTQETDEKPAE